MSRRAAERGVGLIEILVAVVLLSIGFLAAARMQVESLRFSQGAYHHSQAFFLAAEMADRMRANPRGVELGAYDGATTSAAAVDPGCAGRPCTPEEIALQDVHEWSAALHPGLAGGDTVAALPGDDELAPVGTVLADGGANYRIEMRWPETAAGERVVRTLATVLTTERR